MKTTSSIDLKWDPLIHRGNESMPDVLAWLTAQNKRSGEDPSGIGSSGDGHSRR